MQVRILCYKPAIDGTALDNGIDLWTRIFNPRAPKELRTSHTEVWVQGDDGFERQHNHYPDHRTIWFTSDGGTCYTSTMRKPYNGVCRRSASSVLRHPDRWNYFEVEIPDELYQSFIQDMDTKVRDNQGYDKCTIASYFWYKRLGNPNKYICSEFTHLSVMPYVWHTNRLYWNLIHLDCPSPLRLAYALHRSGLDLYSLETGEVILKGKVCTQ